MSHGKSAQKVVRCLPQGFTECQRPGVSPASFLHTVPEPGARFVESPSAASKRALHTPCHLTSRPVSALSAQEHVPAFSQAMQGCTQGSIPSPVCTAQHEALSHGAHSVCKQASCSRSPSSASFARQWLSAAAKALRAETGVRQVHDHVHGLGALHAPRQVPRGPGGEALTPVPAASLMRSPLPLRHRWWLQSEQVRHSSRQPRQV